MFLHSRPRGNTKIHDLCVLAILNDKSFLDRITGAIGDQWNDAVIGGHYRETEVDENLRSTHEQRVNIDKYGFPLETILQWVDNLNRSTWNFSLKGMNLSTDCPSILRYDVGQKFDWHFDVMPKEPTRKLGFSLQLSEDTDYEGGDLEIYGVDEKSTKQFRTRGALIVFPSYVWHRITPVTKGQRLAMVGWVHGDTFQ